MARGYDPAELEPRWQQAWEEAALFRADATSGRPPFYNLHMFPYPSGDLHMGHAEAFSLSDAIARYRRLRGDEVMNPIGWDSFGLPRRTRRSSGASTRRRGRTEHRDAGRHHAADGLRLGLVPAPAYERPRPTTAGPSGSSCSCTGRGGAYRAEAEVNWCPFDQTVLANEQVVDGRCERCGNEVTKKALTQWFFRITDFAQRLLDDMAQLEQDVARPRARPAAQLDRAQRGRRGDLPRHGR